MKSVELALSMCDIVDIYGFTVDPGYTEWLVSLGILYFCLIQVTDYIFGSCISFPFSWIKLFY